MHRSLPLCFFVLIFQASLCLGGDQGLSAINKRCASCHQWAASRGGVEGNKAELKNRVTSRDPHVVGRFSGGELLLVKDFLGLVDQKTEKPKQPSPFHPPSSWMDFKKPVDTTSKGVGPFEPCDLGCDDPMPMYEEPPCRACESEGSFTKVRRRALRDIKVHCGRCHSWASRAHLIVREHGRIIPKIMSGHGIHKLDKDRRLFMLSAFKAEFVNNWRNKVQVKETKLPAIPKAQPSVPKTDMVPKKDDPEIFDDIDDDDDDISIEDM